MRVSATRKVTDFTVSAIFLGAVFVTVILLNGLVAGALRNSGLHGGPALLVSGVVVLGAVLGGWTLYQGYLTLERMRQEAERQRLGLPEGPCCVVWTGGGEEAEFPWTLERPLEVRFPRIAQRLGIEGVVVVDFDISPEGAVKNVHCVDVWPSDIFYQSAVDALKEAEFAVRPGAAPRFGPTYRMPFVFRIPGAARVKDRLSRARPKPARA